MRFTLLAAFLLIAAGGCKDDAASRAAVAMVGGDPQRGRDAINAHGCASCHTVPGIRGANALVGPPLSQIAARTYIAGVLSNTPENLIRWIQDPPAVDAQTAMPNLHVSRADAQDIATYLYTLKE